MTIRERAVCSAPLARRVRGGYVAGDPAVRDEALGDEELAQLRFMRWLYRTGRFAN
jgi:hypothetical protein